MMDLLVSDKVMLEARRGLPMVEAKSQFLELMKDNDVIVVSGETWCGKTTQDFSQRWQRQSRAFSNPFRQADRVEKLAEVIECLEQGDLKLRVRTLESEQAFKRVAAAQKTIVNAVLAGTLVNLATILHINSIRLPAIAAYFGSAIFFLQVLIGVLQVRNLDQQERLIMGTA